MTWYVCRDAVGRCTAGPAPISDDVVATFADRTAAFEAAAEMNRTAPETLGSIFGDALAAHAASHALTGDHHVRHA